MAHPAQCPASFTSSHEAWRLWEQETPSCVSLRLENRKTAETIRCAPQGPTAAAPGSGHTCQMRTVLFVIEFKASHAKVFSFGWIFR